MQEDLQELVKEYGLPVITLLAILSILANMFMPAYTETLLWVLGLITTFSLIVMGWDVELQPKEALPLVILSLILIASGLNLFGLEIGEAIEKIGLSAIAPTIMTLMLSVGVSGVIITVIGVLREFF